MLESSPNLPPPVPRKTFPKTWSLTPESLGTAASACAFLSIRVNVVSLDPRPQWPVLRRGPSRLLGI